MGRCNQAGTGCPGETPKPGGKVEGRANQWEPSLRRPRSGFEQCHSAQAPGRDIYSRPNRNPRESLNSSFGAKSYGIRANGD